MTVVIAAVDVEVAVVVDTVRAHTADYFVYFGHAAILGAVAGIF